MYKPNYSKIVEALESSSLEMSFDTSKRFVSEKEFDHSIWECSHSLLIDNEELLRVFGERWALEKFESDVLDTRFFHSAFHCVDWLFTELTLLRSARFPGIEELTAMVLSSGPDAMSIRVVSHKRGGPFLEGVVRGVAEAFGEEIEVRLAILNPSCSDLQLRRLSS